MPQKVHRGRQQQQPRHQENYLEGAIEPVQIYSLKIFTDPKYYGVINV
jgi:hypothetical protein